MYPSMIATVLTVLMIYLLSTLVSLIRNVQLARRSGLSYVIVPYFAYDRVKNLIMARTLLRLCTKYLGAPSPLSWRVLVTGNWPYKQCHAPFALLGTDTFLTVAPGGILLHTADANVITQVLSRQTDFPKPTQSYKAVNIYGENIVSTEGDTWRNHRKMMSPVFSEKNNQLVWIQSLKSGQAMLSGWLRNPRHTITTLAQDTMLLSLSVIGHAGLGQTIQWPKASSDQDESSQEDTKPPAGHQMTFTTALTSLLQNIYYVIIFPQWILRNAPFKNFQYAYLAYCEWGQYLREIVSSKRQTIASPARSSLTTNDLLSQLLKEDEQSTGNEKLSKYRLSDSDILGNLFVTVIAGHETSANSIHFCLALLAMHPQIQRQVQVELDQIFRGRLPQDWDYEKDLPKLLNSTLNAVLNEQLRLFPAAIIIPKRTTHPQKLKVDGKDVVVPAEAFVRVCVTSAHRNPHFWHSTTSPASKNLDDLDAFRPSRWLDANKSWYQPVRGSYVPFSDGARSCLGKRFAQVEILAVLALILSHHSVELSIDIEPELTNQTGTTRATSMEDTVNNTSYLDNKYLEESWQRARREAQRKMKEEMTIIITLQLKGGTSIPVNIVKRGEERFSEMI